MNLSGVSTRGMHLEWEYCKKEIPRKYPKEEKWNLLTGWLRWLCGFIVVSLIQLPRLRGCELYPHGYTCLSQL